jgi:hypothetical protein
MTSLMGDKTEDARKSSVVLTPRRCIAVLSGPNTENGISFHKKEDENTFLFDQLLSVWITRKTQYKISR